MKNLFFYLIVVIFLTSSLVNAGTTTSLGIEYSAHVADIGWLDWVTDRDVSGTTGEDRQMEAIRIKLTNAPAGSAEADCSITYRAHVENDGWLPWVSDGDIAGTTGESKQMEALEIKLVNCPDWTVRYASHVADLGWQNDSAEGGTAGTTGMSQQMEAVMMHVIPKAEFFPTLQDNLDLYIPVLRYDGFPVASYYNASLQFIGSNQFGTGSLDGYMWKLASLTTANPDYCPLVEVGAAGYVYVYFVGLATSDIFLNLNLPSTTYQSTASGTLTMNIYLYPEVINNEVIWKLSYFY